MEKEFAINITSVFSIGPDATQIGAVAFSGLTYHTILLDSLTSSKEVTEGLDAIPYNDIKIGKVSTNTSGALLTVRASVFTDSGGARPPTSGFPRVLILITDGRSNIDEELTVPSARALDRDGVVVFAVGIGKRRIRIEELREVASRPELASLIDGFDVTELQGLQRVLSDEACRAAASVFIEEDVMVATQLLGTVSYFQYELPDEGLTLRLNVAAGRVVLYASTRIRNPNSAVYDIRLETDATEDVFVSPDDLIMTGVGTAIEGRRKRNIEKGERDSAVVMIFVTVEGLEKNNSFILESTFGDTSTIRGWREMAAPGAAPTETQPASTQAQGVAAFINKVWSILGNEEYAKLISWSECGKNVIVRDYPNFSKEILPHYFKHNKFNSFVRQLNLYGFRKVSHPEQNVLSKVQVSEPVEFYHPNFRRGHRELLHLVQRRPVSGRVVTEEKSTELGKVLTDIHVMKGKQEDIGDMLEAMKQDNAHLKRELELLRQRHTRQQRVLNKIIQFLIHMVYKGRLPASGRRGRHDSKYLMLTDSEGAAPPAKRGRVTFDPSITYPDSPLDISNLAEICDLPIKAGQDLGAIDSDNPLLPLPTITSPPSSPNMNPLLEDRSTNTQYVLESAQLPALSSVVPPTGTTLLSPPSALSTTATTNALATITPSHPSPSSSLSPLPSTSFPPALQHPNAQSAANTSTVEFAAYPDWAVVVRERESQLANTESPLAVSATHPNPATDRSGLSDHLDTHQQELDSLPDFLSNQLSFDPTILNQFINFGDTTVPNYDAIDTARLLETLSQEDDGETAILRERSLQTALVPFSSSQSIRGGLLPSPPQLLDEEDEQSSSLRELLELNKDT
ncbi:Heat shock factor protein 1 [Geodia barretti]|uniref:Heat shock factor protein 1 n=1 Tax=Geodia barretti TaxID=519541 RepID=A0AA35QT22_GEOBA|nr:Heat shock factor protein 1 [Geodia barretti]